MAESFETFIASERTRINGERSKLTAQQQELAAKIAELDKELKAIAAYETVKTGKSATSTASSGTGTRRTGIRDQVLSAVKGETAGISAADVLTSLNATSDADKTSVRNALAALKKNNSLELKDGLYFSK